MRFLSSHYVSPQRRREIIDEQETRNNIANDDVLRARARISLATITGDFSDNFLSPGKFSSRIIIIKI